MKVRQTKNFTYRNRCKTNRKEINMSESKTAVIELELSEYYLDYLQGLVDDRDASPSPFNFEISYHAPHWRREPFNILFQLIDAALAQGHLNKWTSTPISRLWRNFEDMRTLSNIRNKSIVKKLEEVSSGKITETELYDFAHNLPCPLTVMSDKLKSEHGLDIHFEVIDENPFVKFTRDDDIVDMSQFTDTEIEAMLQVSNDLVKGE